MAGVHSHEEIIPKITSNSQGSKRRMTYSRHQVSILEEAFNRNDGYVSRYERNKLAETLNVSKDKIKTWFQNQRMKKKAAKQRAPQIASETTSIALPMPLPSWYKPHFSTATSTNDIWESLNGCDQAVELSEIEISYIDFSQIDFSQIDYC